MTILSSLWSGWLRAAAGIGYVNSRAIMTLLYFTIVLPLGVAMRFLGDPLRLRARRPSTWTPADAAPHSLGSARKQF